MKITFLGQGEFAKPIRQALIDHNYSLVGLDKNPDLIVVASWGKILKKEILDIPQYGALNIHPSLLPKYRGPSPIQATILNGDKVTAVTIIKMDEKIDHGEILQNSKFKIQNSKPNYTEFRDKLANIGAELLIKTIPDYIGGKIKPRPQDHEKATYTKMLKKEDGLIHWNENPKIIERQIRAYYPWPGTYIILPDKKRLIIHKAHLKNKRLIFDQVQCEGKKIISWEEFKHGYKGKLDISQE